MVRWLCSCKRTFLQIIIQVKPNTVKQASLVYQMGIILTLALKALVLIMFPSCLPLEVFWASPVGSRRSGRPWSRWRDYMSLLVWDDLGILWEDLESTAQEKDAWNTVLSPLPPWPNSGLVEKNGWQIFPTYSLLKHWGSCYELKDTTVILNNDWLRTRLCIDLPTGR